MFLVCFSFLRVLTLCIWNLFRYLNGIHCVYIKIDSKSGSRELILFTYNLCFSLISIQRILVNYCHCDFISATRVCLCFILDTRVHTTHSSIFWAMIPNYRSSASLARNGHWANIPRISIKSWNCVRTRCSFPSRYPWTSFKWKEKNWIKQVYYLSYSLITYLVETFC